MPDGGGMAASHHPGRKPDGRRARPLPASSAPQSALRFLTRAVPGEATPPPALQLPTGRRWARSSHPGPTSGPSWHAGSRSLREEGLTQVFLAWGC